MLEEGTGDVGADSGAFLPRPLGRAADAESLLHRTQSQHADAAHIERYKVCAGTIGKLFHQLEGQLVELVGFAVHRGYSFSQKPYHNAASPGPFSR